MDHHKIIGWLFQDFFEQALKGDPITVYGNGNQTRDFTFIDDTIDACVLLMEKAKGHSIYNIANENEIRIEDVAFAIKSLTGSESQIKYIEAPTKRYDYEVERRVGSSEKLFKTTGYKPITDLQAGLQKNIC